EEKVQSSFGQIAGVIVRSQNEIKGILEVFAEQLTTGVFKLTIRISNESSFNETELSARGRALLHSLVSTHSIVTATNGKFVSLLETPEELREYAVRCQNNHNFPVLVGEAGQRNRILASPIILYDYPQIAPESAGDLFDSTEIDEILTLRILTLTDEEKRE